MTFEEAASMTMRMINSTPSVTGIEVVLRLHTTSTKEVVVAAWALFGTFLPLRKSRCAFIITPRE